MSRCKYAGVGVCNILTQQPLLDAGVDVCNIRLNSHCWTSTLPPTQILGNNLWIVLLAVDQLLSKVGFFWSSCSKEQSLRSTSQ